MDEKLKSYETAGYRGVDISLPSYETFETALHNGQIPWELLLLYSPWSETEQQQGTAAAERLYSRQKQPSNSSTTDSPPCSPNRASKRLRPKTSTECGALNEHRVVLHQQPSLTLPEALRTVHLDHAIPLPQDAAAIQQITSTRICSACCKRCSCAASQTQQAAQAAFQSFYQATNLFPAWTPRKRQRHIIRHYQKQQLQQQSNEQTAFQRFCGELAELGHIAGRNSSNGSQYDAGSVFLQPDTLQKLKKVAEEHAHSKQKQPLQYSELQHEWQLTPDAALPVWQLLQNIPFFASLAPSLGPAVCQRLLLQRLPAGSAVTSQQQYSSSNSSSGACSSTNDSNNVDQESEPLVIVLAGELQVVNSTDSEPGTILPPATATASAACGRAGASGNSLGPGAVLNCRAFPAVHVQAGSSPSSTSATTGGGCCSPNTSLVVGSKLAAELLVLTPASLAAAVQWWGAAMLNWCFHNCPDAVVGYGVKGPQFLSTQQVQCSSSHGAARAIDTHTVPKPGEIPTSTSVDSSNSAGNHRPSNGISRGCEEQRHPEAVVDSSNSCPASVMDCSYAQLLLAWQMLPAAVQEVLLQCCSCHFLSAGCTLDSAAPATAAAVDASAEAAAAAGHSTNSPSGYIQIGLGALLQVAPQAASVAGAAPADAVAQNSGSSAVPHLSLTPRMLSLTPRTSSMLPQQAGDGAAAQVSAATSCTSATPCLSTASAAAVQGSAGSVPHGKGWETVRSQMATPRLSVATAIAAGCADGVILDSSSGTCNSPRYSTTVAGAAGTIALGLRCSNAGCNSPRGNSNSLSGNGSSGRWENVLMAAGVGPYNRLKSPAFKALTQQEQLHAVAAWNSMQIAQQYTAGAVLWPDASVEQPTEAPAACKDTAGGKSSCMEDNNHDGNIHTAVAYSSSCDDMTGKSNRTRSTDLLVAAQPCLVAVMPQQQLCVAVAALVRVQQQLQERRVQLLHIKAAAADVGTALDVTVQTAALQGVSVEAVVVEKLAANATAALSPAVNTVTLPPSAPAFAGTVRATEPEYGGDDSAVDQPGSSSGCTAVVEQLQRDVIQPQTQQQPQSQQLDSCQEAAEQHAAAEDVGIEEWLCPCCRQRKGLLPVSDDVLAEQDKTQDQHKQILSAAFTKPRHAALLEHFESAGGDESSSAQGSNEQLRQQAEQHRDKNIVAALNQLALAPGPLHGTINRDNRDTDGLLPQVHLCTYGNSTASSKSEGSDNSSCERTGEGAQQCRLQETTEGRGPRPAPETVPRGRISAAASTRHEWVRSGLYDPFGMLQPQLAVLLYDRAKQQTQKQEQGSAGNANKSCIEGSSAAQKLPEASCTAFIANDDKEKSRIACRTAVNDRARLYVSLSASAAQQCSRGFIMPGKQQIKQQLQQEEQMRRQCQSASAAGQAGSTHRASRRVDTVSAIKVHSHISTTEQWRPRTAGYQNSSEENDCKEAFGAVSTGAGGFLRELDTDSSHRWSVPAYNSETGYVGGLFDEGTGTMYID